MSQLLSVLIQLSLALSAYIFSYFNLAQNFPICRLRVLCPPDPALATPMVRHTLSGCMGSLENKGTQCNILWKRLPVAYLQVVRNFRGRRARGGVRNCLRRFLHLASLATDITAGLAYKSLRYHVPVLIYHVFSRRSSYAPYISTPLATVGVHWHDAGNYNVLRDEYSFYTVRMQLTMSLCIQTRCKLLKQTVVSTMNWEKV